MKCLLLALLMFSQLTWASEPITAECQQAFVALKAYIERNSATLSQAELDTSQAADAVRLSCDGRASAYQQTIQQIASRFLPPPAPAAVNGLSETIEGVLTLAMMIALIVASSGGVVVIGGGNGLIVAPR